MKILIFGIGGMAGHVIYHYLRANLSYEVWGTARQKLNWANTICLDITDTVRVEAVIETIRPNVIINAVGLLNEDAEQHKKDAIYVNSLFPHILSSIAQTHSCRLIHISTDCVFSGRTGDYRESDVSDGLSMYARTKALGEVTNPHSLTIRTSIIGPERKANGIGLLHWFFQQKGKINGYRQVYWNGVSTLELAKAIDSVINREISGLVHLTAPYKITKYELLVMLKRAFRRDDVDIIPVDQPKSDKTLLNTRPDFRYHAPSYPNMIQEMKHWMQSAR